MNKFVQGHFVRKRFGQHFLKDVTIIDNIVNLIHPLPNQTIVEIGPGLGALTKPIIERTNFMTVIELDRDLADRLAYDPFLPKHKLQILQNDVLNVDLASISMKYNQKLRIFGNIPYNISTPIIFKLFWYTSKNFIHDIHLMLPTSIVNRLIASPNSKEYGSFSIIAQYYFSMISLLQVKPTAFIPEPKIYSTLLRMVPYTNTTRPYQIDDLIELKNITKLAFNQRRKIISNSLGRLFSVEELVQLGLKTTLRAENLSIKQYCSLANMLTKRQRKECS